MNSRGFILNICNHEYRVVTSFATPHNSSSDEVSNTITLNVRVYEDGEQIKLDKNSYAMEKITDFIRNSLNGQDSIYWDERVENRFLPENRKIRKNSKIRVYIVVDDDFDLDYYKETNDIEGDFTSFVEIDDLLKDRYVIKGKKAEIDNFLEEAKKHILRVSNEEEDLT